MSDLTKQMASLAALRDWCRVTCACYPNVEIKNLSTSFRDGLAFCAIIHKHRPDLIDFSSLSKDNVYQNNKLAFEIAETKLGIPALLDPNDMVSTKVPDCLGVVTYLSWHYHFFNRKSYAGLASSGSSHVAIFNSLTKSKTPDGLKRHKSSTDLETSREDRLSNTRPRTVCHLCLKPVHLIQRHLIEGKVYHRSCFRCRVCHSTLLPGSYTQGSDAGSLICSHHTTDSESTHPDLNWQVASAENQPQCPFQAVFSLGGLAISSVPHYSKTTESLDRLVCKTADMEGKERQGMSTEVRDGESRDCTVGVKRVVKKPAPPPPLPQPDVTHRAFEEAGPAPVQADSHVQQQEVTKIQHPSELFSPCAQVTEGSRRPVPAPRRKLSSSHVPAPAPRTKTSQTANSSPAAGNSSNQHVCSPRSCHITSPTSGSLKYRANHPWLTIIHPGPWTHLPPAPAPVPTPRSWYRPKLPAANPFGKDVNEDTKPEPADQTMSSVAAGHSGDGDNMGGVTNAVGASSEPAGDTGQIGLSDLNETRNTGGSLAGVTEAAAAAAAAAGPHVTSSETQSHSLPRSLSVPAITSAHCSLWPADMTEANECDQVMSCHSKPACKENPFDRKPGLPKSKTFQTLPSRRATAPGHGFPLIKRKVQSDHDISTENLQVELRDLDNRLEAMEQRGIELERNLRDCKNDEEEEQMLIEWFSLNHERHLLVRRDAELGHLTLQQKLEERQADVEYELRCLLNKQECDWTQDDRDQERRLMDELVSIIDQRNQIISSLDQDMQRERGEDRFLEATMKNKEFQKEGLKELRKSKGRFSPTKVFKMRNHKAESSKDSTDKKS